ncbi:alpha/beta hydrolase family protein [Mucilaginibacter sp.]
MIKKEQFTITGAQGKPMLADLTYDDAFTDAPLIVFAHGFKGFKDWGTHQLVAGYFAAQGYRYLKFNFSHNGTTVEQPQDFADLIAFSENTFSMELEDLDHILTFIYSGSAFKVPPSVTLIGHSMGGGISIIKAAEDNRITRLVTMAAVADFRNLWPKELEEQWKLAGVLYFPNHRTGQDMPIKATLLEDLERHAALLNITAQAAYVKQPWLLLHGTADPTVALSHAHQLKAAQPNALLSILANADHVFGGRHPYTETDLPLALADVCRQTLNFLQTT